MLRPLPILAALALGSPVFAGEPPQYRVIDLSHEFDARRLALNDLGDMAGFSFSNFDRLKVRKADGTYITHVGPDRSIVGDGYVTRMNNSGIIIGQGDADHANFGWIYEPGFGYHYLQAGLVDVNNRGFVAAYGGTELGTYEVATRQIEIYWTFPGTPSPKAINERNEIAGGFGLSPRLWRQGEQTVLPLGQYAGGFATDITDNGLIVGALSPPTWSPKAAFWHGDTSLQLYTESANSSAFFVNNSGASVLNVGSGPTARRGLYRQDWGFRTLSNLTGTNLDSIVVESFNERNEIAILSDGGLRPKLLQPVPEPATLTALGLGPLALIRRHKSRLRR